MWDFRTEQNGGPIKSARAPVSRLHHAHVHRVRHAVQQKHTG
jgi:hypothetical protein